MEAVAKRYWAPIFSFVRAAGTPPDKAADLTQGFIADVLLGRALLASADASRGRFRSFLRRAVINYVRDRHRSDHTKRRSPSQGEVRSGPAAEAAARLEGADATRVFDAHWAAQTVRIAAERAARKLRGEGRELVWTVFERRTLRPQLFGEPPFPYDRLVRELGLSSLGQAAHMAIAGRQAFLEALIEEIRSTLGPGESLDDELRALLAAVEVNR